MFLSIQSHVHVHKLNFLSLPLCLLQETLEGKLRSKLRGISVLKDGFVLSSRTERAVCLY